MHIESNTKVQKYTHIYQLKSMYEIFLKDLMQTNAIQMLRTKVSLT